jgi:hypothetical protein
MSLVIQLKIKQNLPITSFFYKNNSLKIIFSLKIKLLERNQSMKYAGKIQKDKQTFVSLNKI